MSPAAPLKRGRDELPDDVLRERYDELLALRETKPEAEAAAAVAALQTTREASEALVASLRAELARAPRGPAGQSGDDLAEAVALAEQAHADNAELKRQAEFVADELAALQSRLAFYELMTGMSVQLDEQCSKARCVVRAEADGGAVRQAEFDLDLAPENGDEGDLEYVPRDLDQCSKRLPEYLRDPIVCAPPPHRARPPPPRRAPRPRPRRADPVPPCRAVERSQAPGFTQRLLSGVALE